MPWKGGSPGATGLAHPVVQSSNTSAQLYAATLQECMWPGCEHLRGVSGCYALPELILSLDINNTTK